MQDLELYKSKLQDKNEKLKVILEYTSSKDFKITTDEMQHLENYSIKKTKLCKQIVELDNDLKDLEFDGLTDLEDISKIINQNNSIIKQIIQVDKVNNKKFDQINDIIKANMKQLKASAKLTKTYNSVYDNFYGGNCFNKTK